ncbi:MAG: hypothetical protein IID30_07460 [Planctomycetes bacterium]|nr:hypothetical protein [Planctomycetota bacterium]
MKRRKITHLFRSQCSRQFRLPCLLIALGMFMFIATDARAAHDDDARARPAIVCDLHPSGGCGPSCEHYQPRRSYAQRQYDRGYNRGSQDGWEYGLYDGRYCRRFCDRPPYRVRRYNRNYVDGYLDGFAEAYEDGYRRGSKPSRRSRSWRRWW